MRQSFLNYDQLPSIDSLDDEIVLVEIPKKVRIRTRHVEDEIFVDTSTNVWRHERYCLIDWNKCILNENVKNAFRQFIWYRLSSVSPITAEINFNSILPIQKFLNSLTFPWSKNECLTILAFCNIYRVAFLSFRLFYRWAALKQISGFSLDVSSCLDEASAPEYEPYQSVKLRKNILEAADEIKLLEALDDISFDTDYFSFQDNVIAHLSWELGCRPEQVAGIELEQFSEVIGPNGAIFFHIKLIRLKQRSYTSFYRNRVISEQLAIKIQHLIYIRKNWFKSTALFVTPKGNRIKSYTVFYAIADVFNQAGILGGNSTLLRHNMAQKLADQGTPGDLISDLLDHSTKVAAGHYVAATPEIGRIKARALGRNSTYIDLMAQLTGSPINRAVITDARQIVKGVIATQYIGNIGACGLDPNTACEKNPIYSCYTCKKFHPFINGDHADVVQALRTEIQVLLDQSIDLPENKVVLQLERTIEYAEHTAAICSSALEKRDGNEA